MGVGLAFFMVGIPVVYYRWHYADHKRLRVVVPGQVYRCGHLTADGFTAAIERLGIRTVVNLQDEYPDPEVFVGFFDRRIVREKALCEGLNVRYVHIAPDLRPRPEAEKHMPRAVDDFRKVMDDPANYPVLIHCRAGLHRTGVLTAVYRMEYQGWTTREAYRELKAHGFGESACTTANEYVAQYVFGYRPRSGAPSTAVPAASSVGRSKTPHAAGL
jgi:protein tyrosine phosphatase (PTP) superfamily phosphohydrolase (DUF442 family)